MQIAVVGPGAIGSTFAFMLARAGHEVTVVARGARLEQLSVDGAILQTSGERAPVQVRAELDTERAFDLVLITVLATQVEAILPALRKSRSRKVMFMFNTFELLTPLQEAVGPGRFTFGFPGGVFTLLEAGRIQPQIRSGTTVSDPELATLFSAAGIPTVVERDMQSWLRSHAAMVYPLMAIGVLTFARGAGIDWREAELHAEAFQAGFQIVAASGSAILPSSLSTLSRLPRWVVTGLLWLLSQTKMSRAAGSRSPRSVRRPPRGRAPPDRETTTSLSSRAVLAQPPRIRSQGLR